MHGYGDCCTFQIEMLAGEVILLSTKGTVCASRVRLPEGLNGSLSSEGTGGYCINKNTPPAAMWSQNQVTINCCCSLYAVTRHWRPMLVERLIARAQSQDHKVVQTRILRRPTT